MEKLSMGEYGLVVWGAYAAAFVVLGILAFTSLRALRRELAALKVLKD
jgi:heme exporter protein CcmD